MSAEPSSPQSDEPPGVIAAAAEVLVKFSDQGWVRMLADHADDGTGHCTTCRGPGWSRWPCTLWTIAAHAAGLARRYPPPARRTPRARAPRSSDRRPVGGAYARVPAAPARATAVRPFGLTLAVSPRTAVRPDLADLGYDEIRQVGLVREGGTMVPLSRHTTARHAPDSDLRAD